jgi:hypothetical protein
MVGPYVCRLREENRCGGATTITPVTPHISSPFVRATGNACSATSSMVWCVERAKATSWMRVGGQSPRIFPPPHDLGTVIRLFKASAMKQINEAREAPFMSLWQRGYHDHVIRDQADLARVRAYISANAARWAEDEQNPGKIVA